MTTTPRRLASARSMLSSPTPARAAARNLFGVQYFKVEGGPASGYHLVHVPHFRQEFLREGPVLTSNWTSGSCRSTSSPASEIFSVTSTFSMTDPLPFPTS